MTGAGFGLVLDDAAVFPPGDLPLAEAVVAHHAHLEASYARLVGPLVLRPADLPVVATTAAAPRGLGLRGARDERHALGTTSPLDADRLDVAVVAPDVPAALEAVTAARDLPGLRLVALEVSDATVPELRAHEEDLADVVVFVELPRERRQQGLVDALATSPYRAKLRTGGVRADQHPTETELAEAVLALARAGLPFKATAGLHHALRHTEPGTGFEQHGFLNLLAATRVAVDGGTLAEVTAVLATRDADELLAAHPVGGTSLLGSIGTCSITDPVDELVALGLLAPVAPPRAEAP